MNPCDQIRDFLIGQFMALPTERNPNPNQWLPFFCVSDVARFLFLSKYKSITPIECYTPEERKEWRSFVDEIFPGRPEEFKEDAVRIIYTVGILTN